MLAAHIGLRQADVSTWANQWGAWESGVSQERVVWVLTLWAGVWWLGTTTVCTAASRVIYGLRRKVQEAQQLGQYTLETKIGEGAMGAVYRARHALLRRPTAIKLLLPGNTREAEIRRFEREVQRTAQLSHPNTVTVFDFGRTPDGIFYYAMELLSGCDLEALVQVTGAQPQARVVHLLERIAGALSEAHSIGLIHRDIKPANVLLSVQGGLLDEPKILDFGLVKEIKASVPAHDEDQHIAGTPAYLSPEAISAPDTVGPRSDLYSLGCLAYFLLTGQRVFDGPTLLAICTHHLTTPAPRPSETRKDPIDSVLEELVLECLAKSPDDRPVDASTFCVKLRESPLYGAWTQRDAESWWRHFGPRIRSRHPESDPPFSRTIQIDYASR